jgi:hypothetical protein
MLFVIVTFSNMKTRSCGLFDVILRSLLFGPNISEKLAAFLLYLDDGGNSFVRNVSELSANYTGSQPRDCILYYTG